MDRHGLRSLGPPNPTLAPIQQATSAGDTGSNRAVGVVVAPEQAGAPLQSVGLVVAATLVVMTLLMVVALMFAAEIGWLMVDPTPRGEWGLPSNTEARKVL
jgi:hypothetical protein